MTMLLNIEPGEVVKVPTSDETGDAVHIFDRESIDAVNAAYAARRPLLLRGEPGLGKSQLAYAISKVLGCPFYSNAVDSKSESRDLLWTFDAIARLADAQVKGLSSRVRDVKNYVKPEALWWAFNPESARTYNQLIDREVPIDSDSSNDRLAVALIDEIDKADSDLPNGLLEILGQRRFTPMGERSPVIAARNPLIIITTNEERSLPDAFLRRCFVLHLEVPDNIDEFVSFMSKRAGAHFNDQLGEHIYQSAANKLYDDRQAAEKIGFSPPGLAEYLDLLRAIIELKGEKSPEELLESLNRYAYQKHRSDLGR